MKKYHNIDQFIADFPENIQKTLQQIRAAIKKDAPDAEEVISYQMPAYRLKGMLVFFAGFKNHIGFYPTSSGIEVFKDDLANYKWSKGAIQFPIDKPLPINLVKKIVKFRVKENLEKAESKKASKNYINYHNDGSIWAKGKMVDGQPDGYWEWFRKDGFIMRSGYFD